MQPQYLIPLAVTLWFANNLTAQEQVYTPPQFFSGTLYLSTAHDLAPLQASILNAELERTNNIGWLVGIGSAEQREQSPIWKLLSRREWQDQPITCSATTWSNETTAQFEKLKRSSCVWIDARELSATASGDRAARAELLRSCLDRGAIVLLEATHVQADSKLADAWGLLPDFELLRIDRQITATGNAGKAQLQIADNNLLRIGRRELVNISDSSAPPSYCNWPATEQYPEPMQESIASRTAIDLTAARRALVERQLPAFPAETDYQPKLANGSLVIVGGGGASPEIWDKFIELAGGKEARIVILPTAVEEPEYEDDYEAKILRRRGAKEVRILPQNARDEVSKPEYLEQLRNATGIWFGGGRQWRFVDAYWGTPAWGEIKQVLARGGVIGGSSAGATIQGDLLVRGSPLGNQIMVADGYRRGLGLLEGVAIDQHFKQRNRFDDLAAVVKRFPKIYGIGIDESTALVVQSPNHCSVLGQGSVWLSMPSTGQREFVEHASGEKFELGIGNP